MMSGQPESEQIVTYKPYMVSLLCRLQKARANISIKVNKDPTIYSSIILDVQNEQQILFLDELSPQEGHKLVKKGNLIHFDGRLHGVQLQFDSKVLAIESDNNIAMYRLALPEQLLYKQRRRHFRAMVKGDEHLAISLPIPLRNRVVGDIVDISASGFCSRLAFNDSSYIEEEQAISDAIINLPGPNNRITCDIAVRSIRHYPEKGFSLIGSEITDITPNQKAHVERLVAMLDRNQRRSHYA